MAKGIRRNAGTAIESKSKSAKMRKMFDAGKSVAEVSRSLNVGYAFAYGVAKRYGIAGTAANRRKVRAVAVDKSGIVTIQTSAGPVIVRPDGSVTKPRAKRSKVEAGE